jgi:hypothetical protein
MTDLRVDYQLLTSIHSTTSGLTAEFDSIEDQAAACNAAYWSDHRKKLLGTMQNLDHMVTATSADFHDADNRLASGIARASAAEKRRRLAIRADRDGYADVHVLPEPRRLHRTEINAESR